jgi:hypothetical protein
MQIEVPKKTLGEELLDIQHKYAGKKTQTVRETTSEMGKEYMKSLNKVISDHQKLTEPYYIMEIMKPDSFLEGVIKLVHVARRTRPNPEWGVALYKVDNRKGDLTYEWGLPKAEEAYIMMQSPEGWDSTLIKNIKDFLEGTLI